MNTVSVIGDISPADVANALAKAFPKRNIAVAPKRPSSASYNKANGSDLFICPAADVTKLETELKNAEAAQRKTLVTFQTMQKQQKALFDEFVTLRQRYDEQKNNLSELLWAHTCKYHPQLRDIPAMEVSDDFIESDERVGHLNIGEQLGEGQFASVKNCTRDGDETEYALKIIDKGKVVNFTNLMRIANEIGNLMFLGVKTPYIINCLEVIHTHSKLYILTEKSGVDLFDFFDENPEGVTESMAREILASVLKGTLFCHESGVCHRDLKPENILLTYDAEAKIVKNVKLCDFGLSTRFETNQLLTDFCGSPGFFAPEMIVHGAYYGDKADVWSIGCILLELILGHEKFCDVWMTCYDYETLQDKVSFEEAVEKAIAGLDAALMTVASEALRKFVPEFLQVHSSRRSTVRGLIANPWLGDLMKDELATVAMRDNRLSLREVLATGTMGGGTSPMRAPPRGLMARQPSISQVDLTQIRAIERDSASNQEALRAAYNNMSEKERRMMEEYILQHRQVREAHEEGWDGEAGDEAAHFKPQMHLPPIEPATPSIRSAKSLMRKGHDRTQSIGGEGSFHDPSSFNSPHQSNGKSFSFSSPQHGGSSNSASFNSPLNPSIGAGGGMGWSPQSTSSSISNFSPAPGLHSGQKASGRYHTDLPIVAELSESKEMSVSVHGNTKSVGIDISLHSPLPHSKMVLESHSTPTSSKQTTLSLHKFEAQRDALNRGKSTGAVPSIGASVIQGRQESQESSSPLSPDSSGATLTPPPQEERRFNPHLSSRSLTNDVTAAVHDTGGSGSKSKETSPRAQRGSA